MRLGTVHKLARLVKQWIRSCSKMYSHCENVLRTFQRSYPNYLGNSNVISFSWAAAILLYRVELSNLSFKSTFQLNVK